jgi:hypothetical protein
MDDRAKRLASRLSGLAGQRAAWLAAARAAALLAVLAASLLVYHLADLAFVLHPSIRLWLRAAIPAAFVAGAAWALAALLRKSRASGTAVWLESRHGVLRQDVSTVVQCAGRAEYSQELLGSLAGQALDRLDGLRPIDGPRAAAWRWMLAAAVPVLLLALMCLARPGEAKTSLGRLIRPWGEIGEWPIGEVTPGDVRIPAGEALEVAVGRRCRHSYVQIVPGPRIGMAPEAGHETGVLTARLPPARGDFRYRIFSGRRQSRAYRVSVYQPLALEEIGVRLFPPSYTGMSPVALDNQGSFEAVRGSRALITAKPSRDVQSAAALLGSGDVIAGAGGDGSVAFSLAVRGDERYRLMAVSPGGADTFVSSEYRIMALPDLPPQAELFGEEAPEALEEGAGLSVEGRASDDFGLSQVRISYLLHGRGGTGPRIGTSGLVADTSVAFAWDPSGLGLLPGDSLVYWLEAVDNDAVSGPKTGRSRARIIRMPSLADIYRMDAGRDSALAAEVAGLQPEQTELREQMQRLSQAIKESRRIGWQEQAAMERALADQQELLDRLERAADQALENLRPQGRRVEIDAETASKLRELHQLFDQVATEEMRRAMERLSRALEGMDRQEVAKALENMKLSSEELKQKLDQAIAALRELQQQRQMDRMREDLDRLVSEQKELREASAADDGKDDADRLARRQELAARDLEALADRAGQLGEQMGPASEAGEALKRSSEGIKAKGTPSKMSRAGQKLSEGNRQDARDLQQQALEDMAELSHGLESASSSMASARSRARSQALRQRAREVLSLSQQQEDLNRLLSQGGDQNNLAERQLALSKAGARLQNQMGGRQGMLIPPQAAGSLARALQAMERMGQEIMGGRMGQSRQQGQEAVAALNQAAASMLEASSRGGGSQGGGDMMQDMEGLSGQQAEINQQTLGLMPSAGGQEALSQEARSQMTRLAAQQEAVRQGLEEFNRKYADRRDRTDRLDDLAEEMRQAAEDLRRQQVGERTRERQESILNRLLQAQRSLRDQEYSQQRKADPGKLSGRAGAGQHQEPGKIPPPPPEREWRKEPYPLEYQEVIERYFRSLGW